MKKQERSGRSSRFSPLECLETRALLTMTAVAQLPNIDVAIGSPVPPVNLDNYLKDDKAAANFAIVNTSLGTIPVVLTPKTTPITVANFLSYVNKGAYNNTIVHRSVPGFIWQSGGYQLNSSSNIAAIPASSPIKNEFGMSNVRGTIAMAKLGSDPNSATNQFFFNESDSNAANLDNQNGGFTVFGHVVGSDGLAVMDAIAAVPVPSSSPLSSPLNQAPLQVYTAGQPLQAYNLTLIKSITTASEFDTTTSANPNVATATVQGNELTITPMSVGTTQVSVIGYGSDGIPATETFTVNVNGPQGATQSTTPATTPTTSNPPASSATATLPTPVAPTSILIPTAKGALPSSVVAGQKTKIQQTVFLNDPSTNAPVPQIERVTLSLSATGDPTRYDIATASTKVKLKAGKQAKLNLSATHLSATVPAGTYHLLVSVTDPNGAETTTDTGKTLVVQAPQPKASVK